MSNIPLSSLPDCYGNEIKYVKTIGQCDFLTFAVYELLIEIRYRQSLLRLLTLWLIHRLREQIM